MVIVEMVRVRGLGIVLRVYIGEFGSLLAEVRRANNNKEWGEK